MGYQTYFTGYIEVKPPLNSAEVEYLNQFSDSRRMQREAGPLNVSDDGVVLDGNHPPDDQPGLWCQWVTHDRNPDADTPDADPGTYIVWDGGEKFYNASEWMKWIVTHLLAPEAQKYIDAHIGEDPHLPMFTCDHVLNGTIWADGEESDDFWQLIVEDNVVKVAGGYIAYHEPKAI